MKTFLFLLLLFNQCFAGRFRNNIDHVNIEQLVSRAQQVLDDNFIPGNDVHPPHTVPSKSLYPHTWFWDACFIAIGVSRFNISRAMLEIDAVLDGQWKNGMIPHIVFDKSFTNYFPSWEFWQTNVSDSPTPDPPTSGITQPPVLARAILAIVKNSKNLNSTEEQERVLDWATNKAFPAAKNYFKWVFENRLSKEYGNCAWLTHPWASGADNSPFWDEPLRSINISDYYIPPYNRTDIHAGVDPKDRPSKADYDRFVLLVYCGLKHGWDSEKIAKNCPYQVIDPLYNTLLSLDLRMMSELAQALNLTASFTTKYTKMSIQISYCVQHILCNDKAARDNGKLPCAAIDVRNGRRSLVPTSLGLLPIALPSLPAKLLDNLLSLMDSSEFCGSDADVVDENGHVDPACYPLPTTSRFDASFNAHLYWRGPVWINVLYILMQSMSHDARQRTRLRNAIVQLCDETQFSEYADVLNGVGHGTKNFSWSAALLIDTVYSDPHLYRRLMQPQSLKLVSSTAHGTVWRLFVGAGAGLVAVLLFGSIALWLRSRHSIALPNPLLDDMDDDNDDI